PIGDSVEIKLEERIVDMNTELQEDQLIIKEEEDFVTADFDRNEAEKKQEEPNQNIIETDEQEESSEIDEGKKRRRSSRISSRTVKYTEAEEETDGEMRPAVKKGRSGSVESRYKSGSSSKGGSHSNSLNMKNDPLMDNETEKNELECPECEEDDDEEESEEEMEVDGAEDNDEDDEEEEEGEKVSDEEEEAGKNELECPECDYRSQSVTGWEQHIRNIHEKSPFEAGVLLQCGCGNTAYSKGHSSKCPVRSVSVATRPKYPKSVNGYCKHLKKYHKTTLKASGIYLLCSCGLKVKCFNLGSHNKQCNGRVFTLHKVCED
ncbi:hypothetical protein PMAYCL1PPCAC_05363, partial [Pristionchus mayeri]